MNKYYMSNIIIENFKTQIENLIISNEIDKIEILINNIIDYSIKLNIDSILDNNISFTSYKNKIIQNINDFITKSSSKLSFRDNISLIPYGDDGIEYEYKVNVGYNDNNNQTISEIIYYYVIFDVNNKTINNNKLDKLCSKIIKILNIN